MLVRERLVFVRLTEFDGLALSVGHEPLRVGIEHQPAHPDIFHLRIPQSLALTVDLPRMFDPDGHAEYPQGGIPIFLEISLHPLEAPAAFQAITFQERVIRPGGSTVGNVVERVTWPRRSDRHREIRSGEGSIPGGPRSQLGDA